MSTIVNVSDVGTGRFFEMHCLPEPVLQVPNSSVVQQKNASLKTYKSQELSAQAFNAVTVGVQSAPIQSLS
jgi:hypothetical protein